MLQGISGEFICPMREREDDIAKGSDLPKLAETLALWDEQAVLASSLAAALRIMIVAKGDGLDLGICDTGADAITKSNSAVSQKTAFVFEFANGL